MTEQEIAVIQAAMDYWEMRRAVDCGMPARAQLGHCERTLVARCDDLAAENDGRWDAPELEGVGR